MSHSPTTPRPLASGRGRSPVIVRRNGPRTVEGIVAAAAAMAMADGTEHPAERRGLLAFLRSHGLMSVLGRGKTLMLFQAGLQPGGADAAATVLAQVRPLPGRHAAELVADAAEAVAMADGVVAPAERAMLDRLRAGLGLAPVAPLAMQPA